MNLYYTFRSVIFSLLISNWEVSTGRSLYSFNNFIQIKQKVVISSYIEDIETNLSIGKHTLRVFHDILKRFFAKICFDASFMCLSRFVAIGVNFNNLCCVLLSCTLVDNGPKYADWSK